MIYHHHRRANAKTKSINIVSSEGEDHGFIDRSKTAAGGPLGYNNSPTDGGTTMCGSYSGPIDRNRQIDFKNMHELQHDAAGEEHPAKRRETNMQELGDETFIKELDNRRIVGKMFGEDAVHELAARRSVRSLRTVE